MFNKKKKLKGVNLGGWLVLEKWITPSVFAATTATNEINLHKVQNKSVTINHYDNFITEDDFKFLAHHGVNAVRIPVGYWLFGDFPPFPKTLEYLDFAFDMATKYGLGVLIDLHAAPGSQNGYDHSGAAGKILWAKNPENINKTLEIIDRLAKRYCTNKALYGIGLLNEPHASINLALLKDYYVRGYQTVRKHCPDSVAVVISDSFRPTAWRGFMTSPEYKNVVLDSHFYQCFTLINKLMCVSKYFTKIKVDWRNTIENAQKSLPMICGEWSLTLDSVFFSCMSDEAKTATCKEFGRLQLDIFSKSAGWFFWTYKTEVGDCWNFKANIENGLLTLS